MLVKGLLAAVTTGNKKLESHVEINGDVPFFFSFFGKKKSAAFLAKAFEWVRPWHCGPLHGQDCYELNDLESCLRRFLTEIWVAHTRMFYRALN